MSKTGERLEKELLGEENQKEEMQLSETWAQDGLQELEDFIEEQGIYIRQ